MSEDLIVHPGRGFNSSLHKPRSLMKQQTRNDGFKNPSTIAVFRKFGNNGFGFEVSKLDAITNDTILSALKALDPALLPSALVVVRADGSVFSKGMTFVPEESDAVFYALRQAYDQEHGIVRGS